MAISGQKDEDHSKKASLEKAKANGFGQPGVAGRKKFTANDVFEEAAEKRLPDLVKKSFDAIDRALESSNPKVALDAAYKLNKMYYQPDQKVVIEGGPSSVEIHQNILNLQDSASPKERAVLSAFQDLLAEGLKQEEIIEGELVEVEGEEVDSNKLAE